MGFGRTMIHGKRLRLKYSQCTTRQETLERLGGADPKKIVLVIDEISALTYEVFGTTEKALRILYNNEEPFGGISVGWGWPVESYGHDNHIIGNYISNVTNCHIYVSDTF